jgi:hypothetical protein
MSNVAVSVMTGSSTGVTTTTTANGAHTFSIEDLNNNCLQLFLSGARGIEYDALKTKCRNSFDANPLITIRLLAYFRDIRQGGKGEREVFRKALEIMAQAHPKELLHNMEKLQELGRCDDFQDVCIRLMCKYLNDEFSEQETSNVECFFNGVVKNIANQLTLDAVNRKTKINKISLMAKWIDRERQAPAFLICLAWQMGFLKMSFTNVKAILGEYHSGKFDSPWELFVFLTKNLKMPMSNRPVKKKGSSKVYRKLQTTMEQKMDHPQEVHKKLMSGINYAMQKMRTEVLTPLNLHLNTIEVKLASKTPLSLQDVERMPGGAISKYKEKALPKQSVWSQVLELLAMGSMKIKGMSVDLVSLIHKYRTGAIDHVTESQLTAIFEQLLRNIATRIEEADVDFSPACFVSDVSGSMESNYGGASKVLPIDVCCGLTIMSSMANMMSLWTKLKDTYSIEQFAQIALGKLSLPSSAENPFYFRRCITFSERPNFFELKGSSWRELIDCFNRQPCGYSTNFMSVFKNLVDAEKSGKVPSEYLPKRVVAITDAQFDSNFCGGTTSSTHRQIAMLYERELGHSAPELIYWNVAANPSHRTIETDNPDEEGISMMTGYNQNMVKHVLMDEAKETSDPDTEAKVKQTLTPKELMLRVVNDPVYAGIVLP